MSQTKIKQTKKVVGRVKTKLDKKKPKAKALKKKLIAKKNKVLKQKKVKKAKLVVKRGVANKKKESKKRIKAKTKFKKKNVGHNSRFKPTFPIEALKLLLDKGHLRGFITETELLYAFPDLEYI